ncbi:MAG: efflux RND transporter periplasmic adaptor subunit [Chromatiaceae bacterium]|nr:efflux RND transporter periplasmic adaptor subunit [Chromatiaceae bacterium]
MKRFIIRMLLFLVLAGLGALAYWRATKIEVVDVLVKPVEYGSVERIVANTRAGTVEACMRSSPTPSVGGQIARLEVKEGDFVKEGQLLLELWNDDVKAEVSLAQSQLAEAKSSAQAACLEAEVAEREADRLVPLQKRGGASADQTDKAVTQAKAGAARCEAAKSGVMVSESRLAVAKAKVARTRLIAPFAGVVATVTGDLLQYVTPSPPGIPTPPTIDIIASDCFYVTAPIDEVDAPGVEPGLPARIKLDAFPDVAFDGSVKRVAPFVQDYEKQARTVDIEVAFENEADMAKLLAGYSADVEVIIEVRNRVLRVPTEGVIDGKRLFVLDTKEAVLREREVKTGLSNWNYTEVLQGVAEGDLVVTSVDAPGVEDGAPATNTSVSQ